MRALQRTSSRESLQLWLLLLDLPCTSRCVNLLPPQDDVSFLRTAHQIYEKRFKFPEALCVAIRLNDPELVRKDFNAPGNE